jgi:hypothetical protein
MDVYVEKCTSTAVIDDTKLRLLLDVLTMVFDSYPCNIQQITKCINNVMRSTFVIML